MSESPEASGSRVSGSVHTSPITFTHALEPEALPVLSSPEDSYLGLQNPGFMGSRPTYAVGLAESPTNPPQPEQTLPVARASGSRTKTRRRASIMQQPPTSDEGSMDTGDSARKRPKKTVVACDFCRRRKLKCTGERPRCAACQKRAAEKPHEQVECRYEPFARRRGPGKSPKGSGGSKKPAAKPRATRAHKRAAPAAASSSTTVDLLQEQHGGGAAPEGEFTFVLPPGAPMYPPEGEPPPLQTPGPSRGFELAVPKDARRTTTRAPPRAGARSNNGRERNTFLTLTHTQRTRAIRDRVVDAH
ncbi:hypothetical protein FA95DRAFT_623081 [Auriscalpium vulgare]|uniref:Uncharacterized protein n=1 Tax=Auriscalpium vulgare TaxID=40419 RepID=A0ACB8S1S7_9AGAM|nr:hypothetical protein FA95DRAFT_623081 [Auriscalpium vulgare]